MRARVILLGLGLMALAGLFLSVEGTATAQQPPPPPAVTEDGVQIVECDSYFCYDQIAKKYKVWVEFNYQVVNGGVIHSFVYDTENQAWRVFNPLNGIAVVGNKSGTMSMDYFAPNGSDMETELKAKAGTMNTVRVMVRLVPNAQGATPITDEADVYWTE